MVTVYYNKSENEVVFSFEGRMDTVTSLQAGETINDKLAGFTGSDNSDATTGVNVVFDLKEVNFIASSFIRICMNRVKLTGSGNFCIINCDPAIKKTFKIAGLDELLKIS
jgi:anti-anti-sigma factor